MEFLTAPQNLPFTLVLGAVTLWSVVQIFLGAGDALAVDADLGADVPDGTPLFGALNWLGFRQIPLSIWLILAGLCFGMGGFGIQALSQKLTGALFPAILAAFLAFCATIPAIKIVTTVLRPVLPRDETSAVSLVSLVGREAIINIGTARKGFPAEARVVDEWGKTHYVLVEPEAENVQFPAGSSVLLVAKRDHIFTALEGTGAASES